MSLERILGFGTKIQLNKRKTARTISSPFPSTYTRVHTWSVGFPTSVVIETTIPILCYTQWETQRKGQQLKRSLCSRGSIRIRTERNATTPMQTDLKVFSTKKIVSVQEEIK